MITELTKLFFLLITMSVVHELSHILVGKAFGLRRMTFGGLSSINFDPSEFSPISTTKKALVIFSGPISALVISIGFFLIGWPDYGLVCFILLLINLLPFGGSDLSTWLHYTKLRRSN